jgi:hypothetical protein
MEAHTPGGSRCRRQSQAKETARFRVQIVEDATFIEMFFDDHDLTPVQLQRQQA